MPTTETSHWFEAARRGAVSFLLEHLDDYAGSFDSNGKTALMYLALHPVPPPDDLVVVEASLLDKDGHSALCYACRALNTDGIKRLWREEGHTLGLSALMLAVLSDDNPDPDTLHKDMRQQDNCGMTALMYAIVLDRKQYVDLLWEGERGCVDRQGVLHSCLLSSVKIHTHFPNYMRTQQNMEDCQLQNGLHWDTQL